MYACFHPVITRFLVESRDVHFWYVVGTPHSSRQDGKQKTLPTPDVLPATPFFFFVQIILVSK